MPREDVERANQDGDTIQLDLTKDELERFPDFAPSIDVHLQNFRHWYAWGALRDRRMNDARVLVGECLAAHPIAGSLRFLGMGLETVKGRVLRGLHIAQQPVPLYTETIW